MRILVSRGHCLTSCSGEFVVARGGLHTGVIYLVEERSKFVCLLVRVSDLLDYMEEVTSVTSNCLGTDLPGLDRTLVIMLLQLLYI